MAAKYLSKIFNQDKSWLEPIIYCEICMDEYQPISVYKIKQCGCHYCKECLQNYLRFETFENDKGDVWNLLVDLKSVFGKKSRILIQSKWYSSNIAYK